MKKLTHKILLCVFLCLSGQQAFGLFENLSMPSIRSIGQYMKDAIYSDITSSIEAQKDTMSSLNSMITNVSKDTREIITRHPYVLGFYFIVPIMYGIYSSYKRSMQYYNYYPIVMPITQPKSTTLHKKVTNLILPKSKNENLADAVKKQDQVQIKKLLAENADPNWQDEYKKTCLHYACEYGSYEIVRLLIKKAQIDSVDQEGLTPLMIAILNNHVGIARLLLEHGADPNICDKTGKETFGYIFSWYVGTRKEIDFVNLLFEFGAKPDLQNYIFDARNKPDIFKTLLQKILEDETFDFSTLENSTLLHTVIQYGWNDLAQQLIQRGVNLNVQHYDFQNSTPLMIAAAGQHLSIVDAILKKDPSSIEYRNNNGKTALMIACSKKSLAIVRKLYEAGAQLNALNFQTLESPLHYAAIAGNTAIVQFLLLHNVDLNHQDNQQKTALIQACIHQHDEVIKTLLSFGANTSIKDYTGQTAYFYALPYELLRSLFYKYVPNYNDRFVEGNTFSQNQFYHSYFTDGPEPFYSSEKVDPQYINKKLFLGVLEDNIDLIQYAVCDEHADINARDQKKRTPLMIAIQKQNQLIIDKCLELGSLVNVRDIESNTPLHYAAEYGNAALIKTLIERGADINACNNVNETPLHCATANDHIESIKLLLKYDADVDIVETNYGNTPLLVAASRNNFPAVMLLCKYRANKNTMDNVGGTALEYAKIFKNKNMISALTK